jgi:putative membrane protein
MNRVKDKLLLFIKGVGMGAADVVPGVSGGSIALVTKIYQELLDSIKSIDLDALRLLSSFRLKEFWQHVNGSFLLTLLLGILTSIFSLSKLITYLMTNHPIPLWSFFCGLILISALIILKDIRKWNILAVLVIPLGAYLAYQITEIPPLTTPDALWFTFIAGSIAICAMILPGISGSFLLLIMGQYEQILTAVTQRNLLTIGVFGLGCIVGLLSFSRVISWLLKHYHAITIAFLSGFMLGSINKIWPWKRVLSFRMSSSGVQQPFITENIWPHHYLAESGQESEFLIAILAFLVGVILVVGIERIAAYKQQPE